MAGIPEGVRRLFAGLVESAVHESCCAQGRRRQTSSHTANNLTHQNPYSAILIPATLNKFIDILLEAETFHFN